MSDRAESCSDRSPRWELFVVSGSHFDLGWCGDPAECLAYSDFIIQTAVDAITTDYPDYRFTVEYALFMEHFLKRFPDYEPVVKRLVSEGKLEVCTSAVGCMEQILDGELLIRTIVEGRRYVSDTFGVKPLTAQHTDLPGHAAQIPQILALAGVKYMCGSRFHPHSVVFNRVAPDGSSVVFSNHGHHYKWGYMLRQGVDHCIKGLPAQIDEIDRHSPVPQMLVAEEHDLDMPDLSIMPVIKELNSRDLPYKLRSATVTEFFESIDPEAQLPSYTGEAPYGFYTAPAFEPDIYGTARKAENLLAFSEKLSSMRSLHALGAYPGEEIRDGWKALFYPQDHNFAGRHGADNEEQRLNKAIYAHDTAKAIAHEAKLAIAVNIKHTQDAFPVTVFNPCSWPRTDVIEAKAEFPGLENNAVVVRDSDGTEIPCQILKADRARDGRYDFSASTGSQFTFLFTAEDVPALGYRTFYVSPVESPVESPAASSLTGPPTYQNTLEASTERLANSLFVLGFGKKGLESVVRRSDGRELMDTGANLFAEPVVFEDRRGDLEEAIEEQREKELWHDVRYYWHLEKESLTGKKWRASDNAVEIEVIEAGPVRATVRVRGLVMDSHFEQTFSIYDKLDRIDMKTVVDWQGTQNTILTVPMSFALEDSQITYESPFYAVRLEQDEFDNSYRGIGGREVQKWVDISGRDAGVTIATSSGSHLLAGGSVTPILLKSSYSTGEAYHLMSNRGTWEFEHRIVPHSGNWRASKTYRHGWEHASPMLDAHFHSPLHTVPNSKQLPDVDSLLEVLADNVVVTTVKQSDYSQYLILRLFEAEGTANPNVGIRFSRVPRAVRKVNVLEEPIEDIEIAGDTIRFALRRWEVATLLLEY